MPPLTPRRIRAMRKVCLRLGQELARGLEIGLVHEDLGRARHRAAPVRATSRDVGPAVVALDPVHAEKAAEGLGLELIPNDGEGYAGRGTTWGSRTTGVPQLPLPSPW